MNEDNFSSPNQEPAHLSGQESSPSTDVSEPSTEQKSEISNWVADGMGLSDIQKKINTDFGIVMTYMDVRFLVDDLNLELVEKEEPAPKNPDPSDDLDAIVEEPSTGGVTIDVDGVTPPGAMASGSVIFSDGESKKWSIDQFGRLAMTGGTEDYKPSDEDIMEFQKQLESTLRGPTL
ncbi:MAG: hypothetical protein P8M67_03275 [Opitutales bacterium]|nr:hypothetical protein [Opitutales bacterium]